MTRAPTRPAPNTTTCPLSRSAEPLHGIRLRTHERGCDERDGEVRYDHSRAHQKDIGELQRAPLIGERDVAVSDRRHRCGDEVRGGDGIEMKRQTEERRCSKKDDDARDQQDPQQRIELAEESRPGAENRSERAARATQRRCGPGDF